LSPTQTPTQAPTVIAVVAIEKGEDEGALGDCDGSDACGPIVVVGILGGIAAAAAGVICIAVIALLSYRRLKKKKKPPLPVDLEMPPIDEMEMMHNPQFETASELEETEFETASQMSSDDEGDMVETANPMAKKPPAPDLEAPEASKTGPELS
jgi:hypothetical protein